MIKLVILGAGNVAYHLTQAFFKSPNISVVQVYNRSIEAIHHLSKKTKITTNLKDIVVADVYIISVSDNVIPEIASKLSFKNKLVVHTAGSISIKKIKTTSNRGVFYPLQTFSKSKKVDFSTIPICIEAENEADKNLLNTLAKEISNNVHTINSEQRKQLHLAAVFTNNFVNHLYTMGQEICEQNNIPFKILLPLIKETAAKLDFLNPYQAQTGPAKRNDTKTLQKHLKIVPKNKEEIYKLLTKSIQKTYGN